MTDESDFLRAIIAQPDEDTPRLVYADWLQEHDQPERAEFIRVQVELARIPPAPEHSVLREGNDEEMLRQLQAWRKKWSKTNYALRDRERELLDGMATFQEDGYTFQRRNWQLWREPWPARGSFRGEFRRGFIEIVTCTAADWLAHGDLIRARQPVTKVCWTSLTREDRVELHKRSSNILSLEAQCGRLLVELAAAVWPGVEFELPPPGITPQPGDILTDGDNTWQVTGVTGHGVNYELIPPMLHPPGTVTFEEPDVAENAITFNFTLHPPPS